MSAYPVAHKGTRSGQRWSLFTTFPTTAGVVWVTYHFVMHKPKDGDEFVSVMCLRAVGDKSPFAAVCPSAYSKAIRDSHVQSFLDSRDKSEPLGLHIDLARKLWDELVTSTTHEWKRPGVEY